MTIIKYHAITLRKLATDLDTLTSDGALTSDDASERAKAYDRIESAAGMVFASADFFDGLLAGLIIGGVIKDSDE